MPSKLFGNKKSPLRKLKLKKVDGEPKRSKTKPFHYFKGTSAEIAKVPKKQLIKTLEASGISFDTKTDAENVSEELRSHVMRTIRDMRSHIPQAQFEELRDKGVTHQSSFFGFDVWPGKYPTEKGKTDSKGFVDFEVKRRTKLDKKGNEQFIVQPYPVLHAIYEPPISHYFRPSPLMRLQSVISNGSSANISPNAIRWRRGEVSSAHKKPLEPAKSSTFITGDTYSLALISPFKPIPPHAADVAHIEPKQILRINVAVSPDTTKDQLREKKRVYKRLITKQHGIPVYYSVNK